MVVSLQTVIVTPRKDASGSKSSELFFALCGQRGLPRGVPPQKRPNPGGVQVNTLWKKEGKAHDTLEELIYSRSESQRIV